MQQPSPDLFFDEVCAVLPDEEVFQAFWRDISGDVGRVQAGPGDVQDVHVDICTIDLDLQPFAPQLTGWYSCRNDAINVPARFG